jgi:hypothetical protein
MLNIDGFLDNERALLQNSFNNLTQKDNIEILNSQIEKGKIFRQTIDDIKIPINSNFSFQNFFKVSVEQGCFYIAQCLVDFGYPIGPRRLQSFERKYQFISLGIANLKVDLGITQLRPETKSDQLIKRFFNYDIEFEDTDKFNKKYYLTSNNKEDVKKHFNSAFLKVIAKYDDILISTIGNKMYVSFDKELEQNQLKKTQDIFSRLNCLDK